MSVKILSDAELKGDTKLNQHHATPAQGTLSPEL